MLDSINRFRAARGLASLALHPSLNAAAMQHAQDMAQQGFFDHIGCDGSTVGDRVMRQGYRFSFVAENLSEGPAAQEEVLNGWIASPSHLLTLTAVQPVHAGLGWARSPRADNCAYWVLIVGALLP
jgi:uncharacterized protein YkwD